MQNMNTITVKADKPEQLIDVLKTQARIAQTGAENLVTICVNGQPVTAISLDRGVGADANKYVINLTA